MADFSLQVYSLGCLVLEVAVELDASTKGSFAISQHLFILPLQLGHRATCY